MLAPGLKFVDASDNSLSNIQVLDHFVDVERLLLVDRLRYDSPQFGPGMQVSSSVASDSRWDIALRVKPKSAGNFTWVGGASYHDKPAGGIDHRQDAVVSIRHNNTGLNLTVGGVKEKLTSGGDADTFLIKAGWLTDLVNLGKTAFSVDYYQVKDLRLPGDKSEIVKENLEQLLSEVGGETALNKYILAGFYEENRLLLDALFYYEEAINLAPEVDSFKEAYEEFLFRNGLN